MLVYSLFSLFSLFLGYFVITGFIFYKKLFIILMTVYETIHKLFIFLVNVNFTSWKKYLKEKFRTKKEKLERAKNWAWKHETKPGSLKGFYIPTIIPKTDQAKFFQKKRDEDEQKLRDQEILFWEKSKSKQTFEQERIRRELNFRTIQQKLITTTFLTKTKNQNIVNNTYFYKSTNYKLAYLKQQKKNYFLNKRYFYKNRKKLLLSIFRFKFSKKFLKVLTPIMWIVPNQQAWTYLNVGFDTNEFFNFFFIQYFPIYLFNFNFLKNKLLLIKRFKNVFFLSHKKLKNIFLKKNISLNFRKFFNFFLKKIKKKKILNNIFFFSSILKNWINGFFKKLILKNFLFGFLSETKSLFFRIYLHFLNLVKKFLKIKNDKKKFLLEILISRLFGGSNVFFTKYKFRWRYIYASRFFHSQKFSLLKFVFREKFIFPKILDMKYSLSFFNFFFVETFFSNFNLFITTKQYFSKPNILLFFEKFSLKGKLHGSKSFLDSRKLAKTFFVFLWNRVKYYENIRFLLYTSFSQQIKIIDDINVAEVLFKYIIWKGKKLTARIVFTKFLKRFKKRYSLPALAVFVHALLYVEPKVWLKQKKIAGKVYEIPIYISSSRSKRIAVRWLLQAAKKWKRASITESLSQEVWDACLKRGGAFHNKENVHLTVKKNKAYLRWL